MGATIGHILNNKLRLDRLTKLVAFRETCKNPQKAQWSYLRNLLSTHRNTDFGKKYNFSSIKNIRDFQENVPIHTWEDMVPYVEEVKKGNHNALFPPWDKLIMFATTSGTTGQSKFIPVTLSSYRNYGKYWDHTWSNVVRCFPRAFFGKSLYFPGDPEESYIGKIPCGAITGKAYAQQSALVKTVYPYPWQIAKVKDYDLRYYTIMRITLEKNITNMPIANPSTILKLFRVAQNRAEEMIEDIRLGRLKDAEKLPKIFKKEVMPKLRPNPKRAEELESILKHSGDFLPKDYWKERVGIICFASGPMNLYLKQLKDYLNDPIIMDFGLLASEGRFSFPLATTELQRGCCLTLETNFFEFIPEEQMDRSNPDVLTVDELELGKRYFILFTNHSGLYRYNIKDVVEISDFYEKAPVIYFCNKGKHYSNITGEKLSEVQVTECVKRAGEGIGYHLEDFVVCLHWDENAPSYTLLKDDKKNEDPQLLKALVNRVEEELMNINVEYKSKRQSLRLAPLTLKLVNGNGYEKYENNCQQRAHNLSQYKHIFLVGDPDFEKQFECGKEIVSSFNPGTNK